MQKNYILKHAVNTINIRLEKSFTLVLFVIEYITLCRIEHTLCCIFIFSSFYKASVEEFVLIKSLKWLNKNVSDTL